MEAVADRFNEWEGLGPYAKKEKDEKKDEKDEKKNEE